MSNAPATNAPIGLGFFRGLSIATTSSPFANTFFEIRARDLTTSDVSTWGVFTQTTTANQPVLTSTGGYNNGKYVNFSGSPKTMFKNTATTFNCGTNGGLSFAMLININTTATAGWERIIQSHHSTGSEAFVVNRDSNTNNLMFQVFTSSGTQIVRHSATNLWNTGWRIVVFRYRGSDKSIRVWSSSSSTPDLSATGANTLANISINTARLWLCSDNNNAFADIQLGGIMLFDRVISDTEVTNIFSYYQTNTATA
jgi:hypothetical protein